MLKLNERTRLWLLYIFIGLFIITSALLAMQLLKPAAQTGQTPTPTFAPLNETIIDEQLDINDQPPTQSTPTTLFQPVQLGMDTISEDYNEMGVLVFSMMDGIHQHLFVYHPLFFPLTRLTNYAWDDIHPSFSADGRSLAYASTQTGFWEIFVLDLTTYEQIQVTQDNFYEGSPSWSPDGKWIAYESNRSGNLDIFIQSLDSLEEEPIQLTSDTTADYSPRWSPDGRSILFVSLRDGNEEIWLADLDKVDNRFQNISQQPLLINTEPAWSSDGTSIIFSANDEKANSLYRLDNLDPKSTSLLMPGNFGVWNPQSTQIAVINHTENASQLGIFDVDSQILISPLQTMPGRIEGITWANNNLELLLPVLDSNQKESITPAYWETALIAEDVPEDRFSLSILANVDAPYPYLHDAVDESFSALRDTLAAKLGWDFLAILENAYLPITNPSPPEISDNWLYSGRAFQLNTAPATSNWMVTVREDINGKTFWRIYLRTLDQSGAAGMPLRQRIWSFEQRTLGSPTAYEQGGNYSQNIPEGYWIDFTSLAAQYGWTRLPALLNWRTYLLATQHTMYVFQQAENFESALLDIYPPEALLPPAANSVMPVIPSPTPEATPED